MRGQGGKRALSIRQNSKKSRQIDLGAVRTSVTEEAKTSNSAYQTLRRCCDDEAFLCLAKDTFIRGLSMHIRD